MTLEQRLLSAWTGRGVLARTLLPLSLVYRALLDLDRARQHRKRLAREATSTPLRAPVVVIGNLVAGGAGKTPTVIATTRLLREHGFTPGIVSRGHGRSDPDTMFEVTANSDPRQAGDEPLLLRLRTMAPLVVGRDRNAACAELLRLHPEVDVIVSDDGLQHHALRPDVAVIVFDDRGAGNGWLLPAGPLREPMPSRLSACQLVIYNADRPS
ncbi:MAG: tetraacyldisaccharide 4-kinase, partial [Rhizobacter sp.]|nr:tetraacyldisaccharide 4-kinase [Rhizobacter sp.]